MGGSMAFVGQVSGFRGSGVSGFQGFRGLGFRVQGLGL